jgi:hypothetical protein
VEKSPIKPTSTGTGIALYFYPNKSAVPADSKNTWPDGNITRSAGPPRAVDLYQRDPAV